MAELAIHHPTIPHPNVTVRRPTTPHPNVTVRRCGYCREPGHTQPHCLVAAQFGETLHQRVVELRSRDFSNGIHIMNLLGFFRRLTVMHRLILCRKINTETYIRSLVERGKYTAIEFATMDLKKKQITALMQYYHFDNYNTRAFAHTALIQDRVYEMNRLDRFDNSMIATIMHLLGYPAELNLPETRQVLPAAILNLTENENENEKFDCPICMECKLAEEKIVFNCGHGTCNTCLKELIEHDKTKKQYACCLCRAKINDITFTNADHYDAYKNI